MNELWAIMSLFGSSFLSATLLPGSSEIVLVSLLLVSKVNPLLLIAVATVGNTLGGATNLIVGRWLPEPARQKGTTTAQRWLHRYGTVALLFSWVPVVGDVLCVMAGWLRLSWRSAVIWIFIGKALRYLVLAGVTVQGMAWWS
ncbi:YqaA family protein [Musicola keenii]|uniref:YqaA family protein n=1 Tax=Musicola keenii TaxID=2884250 RepID=UPI00177E11D4|nr:YqaA family protein [Musicola keenii]